MFKLQERYVMIVKDFFKQQFVPSSFYTFCLFFKKLYSFVRYIFRSFFGDDSLATAASLSFTSLLSLVPLLAVMFVGFSGFPVFQEVLGKVQNFIFDNLVPASSQQVQQYLLNFIDRASNLTAIGLLFLLITALLLMSTIDRTLNNIWGVKQERNFVAGFMTYWSVLTVGPIMVGLSLMLTSYFVSLPLLNHTASILGEPAVILKIIPSLFSCMAFSLVYLVVPNTSVKVLHALTGGIVATILFESAKGGFTAYITAFPTYQDIYGALSSIPVFFLWVYISWVIILLGAYTTRAMGSFNEYIAQKELVIDERKLLFYAYRTIFELWKKQCKGQSIDFLELENNLLIDVPHLQKILSDLEIAQWIYQTEGNTWILARDIAEVSFMEFYQDLGYALPTEKTHDATFDNLMHNTEEVLSNILDKPLKELFH